MISLSRNIQRVEQLRDYVSVNYVKKELFNWIKESFISGRKGSFIDYMAQKFKNEIKKYEVWIPVPFTSIDEDFSLGKIEFKTVTADKINGWFVQKRDINNETKKRINEYKEKFKKDFQGYAAGVYKCIAEKERAWELAFANYVNSLSILRLFSGANLIPELVSTAYEFGHKMVRTKTYFIISEEDNVFCKNSEILDKEIHFNLDRSIISLMKQGGLEKYDELLKIEKPNEFQRKILNSLLIYSKHTIRALLFSCIYSALW